MSRAKLNDLVSSIVDSVDSYTLPEDLESVRTLLIDFALHIRSLEAELKGIPHETSSSSSSVTCGTGRVVTWKSIDAAESDSEGDEPDSLAAGLDDLTLERHYGNSSTHHFVQNALNIKSELNGEHKPTVTIDKRPQFWETPQVIEAIFTD